MTQKILLAEIAQARSGDKGDILNVALFAPTADLYETFKTQVTTARVRQLFGDLVKGEVQRYEAPNVLGLNFVLHEALDGGASRSLRSDPLGKSLGALLLRLEIEAEAGEIAQARTTLQRRQAPG